MLNLPDLCPFLQPMNNTMFERVNEKFSVTLKYAI